MKKTPFIIILLGGVIFLTGWIVYLVITAREAEPVSVISGKWWESGHADITSEAFVNWNEDDPPLVPPNCAKCHSGGGFIDYIGQDGSTRKKVDNPGPVESVISCHVCHNEGAMALESVVFPSGEELIIGEKDAICSTCHSGTNSGEQIKSRTEGFDNDEVVSINRLPTPHYAFAAATLAGSEGKGGYQYAGKQYKPRFKHAANARNCTQCHDEHSLGINKDYGPKADLCASCHSEVTGYKDYRHVTMDKIDYDGNGKAEGIYFEIRGLQEVLHRAVNSYSKELIGVAMGWADSFPYFFIDTDADGTIQSEEASFPNAYRSFTPRLMRAAFNYQFSKKDPGNYVHNGQYVIQLLHDSIADLSEFAGIAMEELKRP